jgi:hypothetical protein
MCEINPKRAQFYRLEFFTSHNLSDETWTELITVRLVELEQAFNEVGSIRVHIHEEAEVNDA